MLLHSLVFDTLSALTTLYDPYEHLEDAPICNCSSDWPYRCDDPELEYYRRVRMDPRLRSVLQPDRHDLATYVAYREFLRDQFPHGVHSKLRTRPWEVRSWNLLEMLDEADRGERFLCGQISKMLAQMILATGGFARLVRLNSADLHGHAVTEAWVPDLGKWVVLDADNNLLFTDSSGNPLNALELHRLWKSAMLGEVVARPGTSRNTLYRPERHERLLAVYGSIAFDPRANWVAANYPWWHPGRHPQSLLTLWRSEGAGRPTFSVAEVTDDAARVYFEPCRPSASVPR